MLSSKHASFSHSSVGMHTQPDNSFLLYSDYCGRFLEERRDSLTKPPR